ncbi:hypothetical protein AB4Z14_18505 [Terrabacter sp. 2TAF16]|uniref:hypothetical protein n=1 Tax=unclassified Terrabacter TaxID=2630222 RepID=UPI003F96003C
MADVNGLVMVEGRPGSGRTSIAEDIVEWLVGEHVAVEHRAEGQADHPVDVDHVVVLDTAQLLALAAESTDTSRALLGAAEQHGDAWVVRPASQAALPEPLRARVREVAGRARVPAELTASLVAEAWARFGANGPGGVHVWESALLRSPDVALVRRLVDAVRAHQPVVVYLDDDREIGSSRQGQRRELDLVVVAGLDVPTLVVPVGDGRRDDHTAAVRDFVADHLGLTGRRDSQQVA